MNLFVLPRSTPNSNSNISNKHSLGLKETESLEQNAANWIKTSNAYGFADIGAVSYYIAKWLH